MKLKLDKYARGNLSIDDVPIFNINAVDLVIMLLSRRVLYLVGLMGWERRDTRSLVLLLNDGWLMK